MSVDEFDPAIERLFSRAPSFADADAFTTRVETRLASGSRLRTAALTVAGVLGGVVAVSQAMASNLNLGAGERTVDQGMASLAMRAQDSLQTGAAGVGLSGLDLSSAGGMQLFWLVTAALVGAAVLGVSRLSQEV